MSNKSLILNADDFGMCHSYNVAIFHLLEENKISSSTLMPVTPGCEEAICWCQKKKIHCVGLHTTFTSEWKNFRWRSLTHLSSLEDADGFLYSDIESFLEHATTEDIKKELEAQFSFFEKTGIYFSHVDNHMGSIYPYPNSDIPGFLSEVFKLCNKYGKLPFRMYQNALYEDTVITPASSVESTINTAMQLQIPLIDNLYSYPFAPKENETYTSFKQEILNLIYKIPAGINELYFHPSVESDEVKKICSTWQRRVWELQLLFDEDFTYALKDANIQLISYSDIK
ncbi:polysaccharide deacetylase family protein [Lachnoclostridium phytofermentans]|uniref:polysaccharide deacetylase family protein n=1 Tax=Lachnoclostridium phytofermentans TaxID=66219 RepID=UPI000496B3B0|nr:polysaccharide deacetylase family protein [Lachnoclostridium phytofermentans]